MLVQESGAPDQPNNALEMYWQFGPSIKDNADTSKDNVYRQACVDLMIEIMQEPLYNELRTKQQLGYSVSCGIRDSHGVPGLSVQVCSATYGV